METEIVGDPSDGPTPELSDNSSVLPGRLRAWEDVQTGRELSLKAPSL